MTFYEASAPSPIRSHARPHAQQLLRSLVTISALLHDIGKNNVRFDAKLDDPIPVADPVRHELISVALLRRALGPAWSMKDKNAQDSAVLEQMRDGEAFAGKLAEAMAASCAKTPDRAWMASFTDGSPFAPDGAGIVLKAIVCLVLTHHRLVGASPSGQRIDADLSRHVAVRSPAAKDVMAKGRWNELGDCADLGAWASMMSASAKDALSALGRIKTESPDATGDGSLMRALIVRGRTALIAGDTHASMRKSSAPPKPKALRANSRKPWDIAAGRHEQTLARHLVAVAKASSIAVRAYDLPPGAFPCTRLPEGFLKASTGMFAWQAEAARLTDGMDRRHGFLAFVVAGTGTGKTRAIPAILAGRGDVRYSVCLGLRTLTLQTGQEYVRRLGFPEHDVAVATGSALRNAMHALSTEDGEPEPETASAEMPDLGPVVAAAPRRLPSVVERYGLANDHRAAKAKRLVASPILVCTIDQLMPPVTTTKSRVVAETMRIASADLVIDEIDDFGPEDVAAIARLVELAASYGRAVIVSSATLPPAVAQEMHRAYASGHAMREAMIGSSVPLDIGWFSHHAGISRLERRSAGHTGDFKASHLAFAGEVAAAYRHSYSGRRVGWMDTSAMRGIGRRPEIFAGMKNGIEQLHMAHASTDPVSGRRVSTGVVRMANVPPAIDCATWLARHGSMEDLDVMVVSYVGTLLPAVRHAVESKLAAILNRRTTNGIDPIFAPSSPLRAKLDALVGSMDLCVIVVTTILEDVGRDHDFDFAILESMSMHAVTQISGRVRRHRTPLPASAAPNVVALTHCIRDLEGRAKDGLAYAWPGPETPLHARDVDGSFMKLPALPDHDARRAFLGEDLEREVSVAALVEGRTASPMAVLEARRWSATFDAGDGITMERRASDATGKCYLTDVYHSRRKFRRNDGAYAERTLFMDGDRWCQAVLGNDGRLEPSPVFVKPIPLEPEVLDRFLLPIGFDDVQELVDDLAERLGGGDDVRRDLTAVTLTPTQGSVYHWHPVLGMVAKGD